MNQLTELYKYIKQLAEDDNFVNAVYRMKDIEQKKEVITPVVGIDILSGGFTNGQTIIFNVEIAAFSIRDINKEIKTDTFWGNDNELDNQNTCISILNRIWLVMYRDFEENNITSSDNPTFEIGSFEGTKLLDGARMTFDIEMPNTLISLCQ